MALNCPRDRRALGVLSSNPPLPQSSPSPAPGMTTPMMVALGKEEIKTLEDFAGCAADDLTGWTERKDGETQRFDGLLDSFGLSRNEAEQMIMDARLKAGWVTEEDLAEPEPEADDDADEEPETKEEAPSV